MFKLFRNIISCILIVCIILVSVFALGQLIPNQYIKSYTAGVVDKYEVYNSPDRKPSVILVGGSNLGFGMNCEYLHKVTGKDFLNIGIHAGLKREFELNLAKTNVLNGDIIVLALEYSAYIEDKMNEPTTFYAVDGNKELMKLIPADNIFNLIRYYPLYLMKKVMDAVTNPYPNPSTEAYMRSNFDEYGDNKFDRPVSLHADEEMIPSIHISKEYVSDESVKSLKVFKEYCESKGAKVYMSCPSVDKRSVITSEKEIKEFEQYVYDQTGIEQISSVSDYILDSSYFYDTYYHLNNTGVQYRTELFLRDLEKVM